MIYLESNIDAHIGYNISDVSHYIEKGRNNLLNGTSIVNKITQLIRILEMIENGDISDSMRLSLCPSEVIHIQNLYFDSTKYPGHIMQFHTKDISKRISIIDNIVFGNLRLVTINRTFYDNKHFSLLKHKEVLFDQDPVDYITIFVDKEFLNTDSDTHEQDVIKLIFNCVDWFISDASGVNYNIFSEHPLAMDKKYVDNPEDLPNFDELSPRMIFRNRLSTNEIMFISEYFIMMCYYMKKYFNITAKDMEILLRKFPFYHTLYNNDCIYSYNGPFIDIMYEYIEKFSDQNGAIDCEYEIAELIRDSIMNRPYKD